MTTELKAMIIILIYRVVTIGIGTLSIYWGYRLFIKGIFEKVGELKAAWGERNLSLKTGIPRNLFCSFRNHNNNNTTYTRNKFRGY